MTNRFQLATAGALAALMLAACNPGEPADREPITPPEETGTAAAEPSLPVEEADEVETAQPDRDLGTACGTVADDRKRAGRSHEFRKESRFGQPPLS